METQKLIQFWKANASKELVKEMEGMSKEGLEMAFENELTFGTAGIRGVIGPGPNRMNIYTIIKSTYGYAKFLKEKYKDQEILVVIGTDNRHKKEEFSNVAAQVLTSFGIKVAKSLIIPTPLVSFSIRNLKAQGAIIITASHNPANNNGYKVYDDTGAQLLPDASGRVLELSKEKEEYLTYKFTGDDSLVKEIPESTFAEYAKEVKAVAFHPNDKKDLKVVFSPQHGTSAKFIPPYLRDLGYEVIEVKEQMTHDPDFSNTPTPNPEMPGAYELGLKYADKHDADIFITTDPDADRIGVCAKRNGKWAILNGNQTAPILFQHILENADLKNSFIVYSFVSTHLVGLMAKANNVKSYQVATGFKWIGNLIEKFKDQRYIFGFEESYGSLIDPRIARDKDSLQAAVLVSEIANKAKKEGKTLWDLLEDIYKKYGYFLEETKTKEFLGRDPIKDRVEFMDNLRSKAKSLFDDEYEVSDLTKGKDYIAPMNLVKFSFSNGSWIAARPSGTEPKIKFYKVAVANGPKEIKEENEKLNNYIKTIMDLKPENK